MTIRDDAVRVPCVLVGDCTLDIVDRTGKTWRFEWHHYCGPNVVNRRGDPLKKQPGPRSAFWEAVTEWDKQGRKVSNGIAVWTVPAPTPPTVCALCRVEAGKHGRRCDPQAILRAGLGEEASHA